MNPHQYSAEEIQAIYRVIRERRDMRHFHPQPLADGQLARFIAAGHQAPSVGFMQPWRFIRISDPALRQQIHGYVDAERLRTAEAVGERSSEFMQLKLEGILSCAEVLVVA